MNVQEHRPLSLDDVLSFNDDLLSLARTGLPFELEPGDDYASLSQKLAHANARLALRVGRGQSVEAALDDNPELTPQYRSALQTWFHCDKSVEAFDTLTAPAEGRREMRSIVTYSLLQPLLILSLLYLGFTYLVLVTAPRLESIHAQISIPSSYSLSILTAARSWYPVWAVAVPLLVVLAIGLWTWIAPRTDYRWLPWRAKTMSAIAKANYAEKVASLIERNHSLAEALAILAPLAGESVAGGAFAEPTRRLIEADRNNETASFQEPQLASLPPLARWAFSSGLKGQPLANALRFASRTYNDAARVQSAIWRVWLPILCTTVIGGCLVFLFGLSLFLPMVELLKSLTRP